MKRLGAVVAGVVLVAVGSLSGCAGGDGSDYCNRVRDYAADDTLNSLDVTSREGLSKVIEVTKLLLSDAPDEVRDDYDVIIGAYEGQPPDKGEIQAAQDTIMEYDEDNCDVEYQSS
jgi:hypothetical protein